jgi:catechol 2,3-dioxygenase-like lactoylglutathione lyase family enzyme
MKTVISNMVQRFEGGTLSRRDLIQGLTMLVAATQVSAEESAPAPGLAATGINHTSVLVSDLERSTKFYQNLFGLSVVSEDKEHSIVRLGRAGTRGAIVSIRKEKPYGTVDHFAIAVENFNKEAVSKLLTQREIKPLENWQYGFYINDPDGANVQIV